MQCSSGFSARGGGSCPHCPLWLRHWPGRIMSTSVEMIVYASFRPSDRPIKLVKLQIFAKKCSAVFQVILEYIYNYITVIGGE